MQHNSDQEEATQLRPKKLKSAYNRRLLEEDKAHHGGDSHGTEMGWLVSYADMMTLLFGLFVLLYVMASEKKGTIEENMKEVSEKYFSEIKTEEKAKKTPKDLIDPEAFKKLQAEIAKLRLIPDQRALVVQLQKTIEELKKMQNPDQREIVKQLQTEIEKLKKLQNPDQSEQVKQLQAQLEKLKQIPDQRQIVVKLEAEIERLKKLQNPNQSEQVKQLQAELDKIKSELEKLKQIPDQRTMVAEMQKKIEELIKQNQELSKREIASVDKKFMMISAIWLTEKHDVDLYVTDPDGFVYNFKNKRGPSSVASFEIDSRFGPGLELWKTEDLKPGKYQIEVKLYKQYENTKDAEVKVHVVTSKGSQYLPSAILNLKTKEKKYHLNVDEKGNISVL